MLQKRIDLSSLPYGLAIAGEDIIKGRAVVVKNVSGVLKAFYPSTQAEADAVKGFATFRIEDAFKADVDCDVIKAGTRLVIYTLIKDNMWGTTEVDGTVAVGDSLVVDFDTANKKGMLRKLTAGEVTASRKPQFELFEKYDAGYGYTTAMFDVEVK